MPPDSARIQAILNFVMHWRDVFKFWFKVSQYNGGTKIRREVTQTRMVSWSRLAVAVGVGWFCFAVAVSSCSCSLRLRLQFVFAFAATCYLVHLPFDFAF